MDLYPKLYPVIFIYSVLSLLISRNGAFGVFPVADRKNKGNKREMSRREKVKC